MKMLECDMNIETPIQHLLNVFAVLTLELLINPLRK